MKFNFRFLLTLTFSVLLLSSCKEKNNSSITTDEINTIEIKYAKGFDIKHYKDYTLLIIKAPYPNSKETFEYVLQSKKSATNPASKKGIVTVPVQKIVVTSTTHIPMLELLGVENTLIGFPNTTYISSDKTRALIDNGSIKEIGIKGSLNTEILLELQPDIVVGFSMNKTNGPLNLIEKSGIPVLLNGDWLEETPLGRAEWIKFFGALYHKGKEADSIFKSIEANYLAASALAKKATKQPTILSGAVMSKDIWNLPAGESFVSQFLTDANTDYLWKDSKGKGSLSISFETVLDRGQDADYWIAPGYFSSKKQLLNSNKHYLEFAAYKKDQIYVFANKKGVTGGVLYFELGPTRPDLVLKDIIKITHPELLKDYQFTFFEKMN